MAVANRHDVTLGNYGAEFTLQKLPLKTRKKTRNDRKNATKKREKN
jgi:hypothetical protein